MLAGPRRCRAALHHAAPEQRYEGGHEDVVLHADAPLHNSPSVDYGVLSDGGFP
jgi:hypothetical protein